VLCAEKRRQIQIIRLIRHMLCNVAKAVGLRRRLRRVLGFVSRKWGKGFFYTYTHRYQSDKKLFRNCLFLIPLHFHPIIDTVVLQARMMIGGSAFNFWLVIV